MKVRFRSDNPTETLELGRRLGRFLLGGDVVLLKGDLGAGKTALAQGIGQGLGVTEGLTSPTFTLIQEYPVRKGQLTLVHMDLYRLRHPEEAEVIGVEDHFQQDKICVIEWPEVAAELLPDDALVVELKGSGDEPRRIIMNSSDSGWAERLNTFAEPSVGLMPSKQQYLGGYDEIPHS